jgi:hypothetical protein
MWPKHTTIINNLCKLGRYQKSLAPRESRLSKIRLLPLNASRIERGGDMMALLSLPTRDETSSTSSLGLGKIQRWKRDDQK